MPGPPACGQSLALALISSALRPGARSPTPATRRRQSGQISTTRYLTQTRIPVFATRAWTLPPEATKMPHASRSSRSPRIESATSPREAMHQDRVGAPAMPARSPGVLTVRMVCQSWMLSMRPRAVAQVVVPHDHQWHTSGVAAMGAIMAGVKAQLSLHR